MTDRAAKNVPRHDIAGAGVSTTQDASSNSAAEVFCLACQRSHSPPVAIAVNDPCPHAIPNSAHEHEWEGVGQIDRRCKLCGKVETFEPWRNAIPNSAAENRCVTTIHSNYVTDHRCQLRKGHEGDCLFGRVTANRAANCTRCGRTLDDPALCYRCGWTAAVDAMSPNGTLASEADYEEGVRCVVMPCCAFTFDACHTDHGSDPPTYTCPICHRDAK